VFQPTFLYESIWCVLVAIFVIWADKRFNLGHGRAFATYVLGYTIGRGYIEHLRSDYAHHILGLRLNDWTAIIVGLGALIFLVICSKRHPGRETPDELYRENYVRYVPETKKRGKADPAQSSANTDVESGLDAKVDTNGEAAPPGDPDVGAESESEAGVDTTLPKAGS
jgi:hypothetical protein